MMDRRDYDRLAADECWAAERQRLGLALADGTPDLEVVTYRVRHVQPQRRIDWWRFENWSNAAACLLLMGGSVAVMGMFLCALVMALLKALLGWK